MIRFKSIKTVYPNGLTWADYYLEDINNESWHPVIQGLIKLIKEDSKEGWQLIFNNLISSLKSSVFYPVMTSFSDWQSGYSLGGDLIKFISQQDAIISFYKGEIRYGKEPEERIYPTRTGKGGRWLFGHQMPRVESYSNDILLEMFYEFAWRGKAIPVAGWENNLNYGEKIAKLCEDYASYVRIAYLLPPSWYLLDRFKLNSWLKFLTVSGVLSDGLLHTSRGIRCIAKDGHECNSLVELEIDNWLYLKGIEHEKEPFYPRHNRYNESAKLRADFLVEGIYIEYAGLMSDQKYADKMSNKRKLAEELGLKLIVIEPQRFKDLDTLLPLIKHNK